MCWTWKGSDVTWRGVSTTLWRGEKLNEYTRALASERMPLAPLEIRVFFITAGTWGVETWAEFRFSSASGE